MRQVFAGGEMWLGDCLELMAELPDGSVDSVVTDPPYGLSFMGKKWDYDVPSVAIWAECLRVLKPGGHLLAFAGTRTQHRMAVRIEDAGFEIRDMIAWVYGSGFPKSLDVSKAIDKAAGAERAILSERANRSSFDLEAQGGGGFTRGTIVESAPATPEAAQWQGWGTALKPALEPITVARKPPDGTVAANVLAHGTGALNINECRVGTETAGCASAPAGGNTWNDSNCGLTKSGGARPVVGRWPANLIHDGSDEVLAAFPDAGGQLAPASSRDVRKTQNTYGDMRRGNDRASEPRVDSGSSARFFYCPKTSKRDRGDGNVHPTVKPTDLMAYLCRLVTPPSGLVLDPFMGSGSTCKAATRENFRFLGMERDVESFLTACDRVCRL